MPLASIRYRIISHARARPCKKAIYMAGMARYLFQAKFNTFSYMVFFVVSSWDDMPVITRVKAVMDSHRHKSSDSHCGKM